VVNDVDELEDHTGENLGAPKSAVLRGPEEDHSHVIGVPKLARESEPKVLFEVGDRLVVDIPESRTAERGGLIAVVKAEEAIDLIDVGEREALPVDDRTTGEEEAYGLHIEQREVLK